MKKEVKSIYVHIPFCIKKCRYCAFNSYQNKIHLQNEYFNALYRQIENCNREKIESIYIGGGTPTAVDENNICRLLDKIRSNFDILPTAEITIEANPKTVTEEKLKAYAKSGINRISIGAQSFCDNELAQLGRIHSSDDIANAVNLSHKSGIDNINIDIMYAIPQQTEESLFQTLKKAISLDISHISLYGLAIEEGTPLFDDVKTKRFIPFSDEKYADMYEAICAFLQENGFVHYEISNFAKKEELSSQHNLKYWHGGEYFGFGAGASGFENSKRYTNISKLEEYIKNPFSKEYTEEIDNFSKMSEYVILNLRLLQSGISISEFKEKFGCNIFSVFGKMLKKHLEITKMLQAKGDRIVLSPRAYYVCNSVMCDFI